MTRTPLPPGRLPLSLHRVFDEVWLHDDELPGAESFGPMAWRRLRDGAWESLDLPGDVIGATEDAAGRWAVCRSGRWNIETGDRAPRGDDPDDALSAAIDRSAIVARGDDRVLVATEDGMELFSLPGGDRVWRIATLLEHPILVGNRIVNGNAVHDLATGAHMHGKFDADRFSRRSVVTGEHLWFLATPPRRKSSLCCVRLGDGKQVAKIALDFDPMGIYSAPGQLLITAFAGVHCFA